MTNKSIYKDRSSGREIKEIDFAAWGGIDNFLAATSTGAGGTQKPSMLRRVVPWLAKACAMTATAVASLPFELTDDDQKDKKNPYDKSSEWKNKLGGLDDPTRTLRLIAESLCGGKAYVIPTTLPNSIVNLQYCAPHTVVPLITTQGLSYFPRTSDWGQAGIYAPAGAGYEVDQEYEGGPAIPLDSNEKYTANGAPVQITGGKFAGEMLYFWLPDSDIEIGPAKNYPMATALLSTKLISSMDITLNTYADRGFVPATLLAVHGMVSEEERIKAETWYNNWLRGWSKFVAKIINSEKMDIKQVGAGFTELHGIYKDLTHQQIENIGSAFGIPAAIFMADMAFASEVTPMVREWYTNGVFVTIYQTIEGTLNRQLFKRFHKTFKFIPESLRAFRTDQIKLANAFRMFVSAGVRPSIAAQVLEMDIPEGVPPEKLDEHYDKELISKPVAPLANAELAPQENPVMHAAPVGGKSISLDAQQIKDLDLWRQMAVRFGRKSKPLPVDFECKALPEEVAAPIRERLKTAQNELDILKAFDIQTSVDAIQIDSEIKSLLEGIRLEVSAMKSNTPPPEPQPFNLTVNNHPGEAPQVTVKAAESPVVNVAPAQINVNPPAVNVTVTPSTATIQNTVNVPENVPDVIVEDKPRTVKITRDKRGQIDGMEEK